MSGACETERTGDDSASEGLRGEKTNPAEERSRGGGTKRSPEAKRYRLACKARRFCSEKRDNSSKISILSVFVLLMTVFLPPSVWDFLYVPALTCKRT